MPTQQTAPLSMTLPLRPSVANDGRRVAVLQSNYIPWKGYFDIMHDVDLFVFYDDVQYTKNDWRNRNRVKTQHGPLWLTVPVGGSTSQRICDVEIRDQFWARKHYKSLCQWYSRARYFEGYRPFLEEVYLQRRWTRLSDLNQYLIRTISTVYLGIDVEFKTSSDFCLQGRKADRLMDLLRQLGTRHYVSGPSADCYLKPQDFQRKGMELHFKDYGGYPEYQQLHAPFDHYVSILDLLFQTGPDAVSYIWGWREPARRQAA